MFELTYKDSYQVERTLKYEDYEALMLALSGCVTLPDTLYVTSLTFECTLYLVAILIGQFKHLGFIFPIL